MNGSHKLVVGPKLQRLFFSNIKFCDRHIASEDEFLRIEYLDGRSEHLEGPRSAFFNVAEHRKITVMKIITLGGAGEGVVVYSRQASILPGSNNDSNSGGSNNALEMKGSVDSAVRNTLTRDVVRGPTKFMPTTLQSVHTFTWGDRSFSKIRFSGKFSGLTVKAHSSDRCGAMASFDLSYRIHDVGKVLDCCDGGDLKRHLLSALEADLFDVSSGRVWREVDELLRQKIGMEWKKLTREAVAAGLAIEGIEYKGFTAGAEMEAARRRSREEEDKIKREADIEKRRRLAQRERVEQEMEIEELESAARRDRREAEEEMARRVLKFEMEQKRLKVEEEEDLKRKMDEGKEKRREKGNGGVVGFLKELKAMDVDLTRLLCGDGNKPGGGDALLRELAEMSPALRSLMALGGPGVAAGGASPPPPPPPTAKNTNAAGDDVR